MQAMEVKWLSLISYFLTINDGRCVCLSPPPLSLQLILEYASWRSWEQVVLFNELESSTSDVFTYRNLQEHYYTNKVIEPITSYRPSNDDINDYDATSIRPWLIRNVYDDVFLFAWSQRLLSNQDCVLEYTKPLLKCLGEKGISVSIQSSSNPKLPDALEIQRHRIGSVVLLDGLNLTSSDNVLKVASNKKLFNYYISWLLITNRNKDVIIDTTLRNLTIGINTDVVVATAFNSDDQIRESTHSYLNRHLQVIHESLTDRGRRIRVGIGLSTSHVSIEQLHGHLNVTSDNIQFVNESCSAFRMYGQSFSFETWTSNNERSSNVNVTKNLDYSTMKNSTMAFYLVHVYKIRITDNSSLVVDPLGSWNPGAPSWKFPVSTELRNNFNGLAIIVGILNDTSDGQARDEIDIEEDASQVQPLHDFIEFLTNSLNASMDPVPYEKLGTVTNKVWSNLLGDVYNGNVDIGLGYITITEERQRDMSFTHPLIRYTRNIYFRPPESGSMRDIFLQPFNNRMLLCVALMHFLIIVTIGTINYAVKNGLDKQNNKHASIGEATLWCMSILCMQGSSWSPTNISGKTALLASLVFSLVTYNAYAGFITSILSVQATGIRTLEDVLRNNFKLGYSDIDDEYMRNANDSDLRQLYIKAFNGRQSRLDTTLGLQKAMKGGYAFFVSATLARRALGTCLIHERCTIKEIEVRHTFTTVALPMEKASPYAKIINHSVLRMRERGVIDRIREKMLPAMPKCQALTTFHSARIADVYSAFIILMIGAVTSLCLGLFERIWVQRRSVKKRIIRGVTNRRAGLLKWGHSEMNVHQEDTASSNESPTHIVFAFPKNRFKKRAEKSVGKSRILPRSNTNKSTSSEEKSQTLCNMRRMSERLVSQKSTEKLATTEHIPDLKFPKQAKRPIFPFQN